MFYKDLASPLRMVTMHINMCRNEDFHGNDVISLHASSRNGVRRTQFPTFVEPINDPPVILAPSSIFLSGNQSMEGHKIFDKHRDTFQFSIVEPDLHNFPGTIYEFIYDMHEYIDCSWCCLCTIRKNIH